MNFIIYDIILLVLFAIFISVFLYIKRKNLKKEGILFLYKTKWGIKLINYTGNKYKKTLKVLSYVSIGLGYCLMATMFYLFYGILKIYISRPDIVSTIKVPPIMPLIPYIDKVVPFLPPFYFTYWIVILAVIAITHEFAHGIFMRRYNIKIKSTGFGFFPFFLPIFPVAFVEQDEKDLEEKSKFKQMAVLSAGTFANILTAIFFFAVMWIFFSIAFAPSGVIFDSYAYSAVGIANISMINGISLDNPSYKEVLDLANETGLNKIKVGKNNYATTKEFLEKQKDNEGFIILYEDAPAINAGLRGAIIKINDVSVNSKEKLGRELFKYTPGEKVTITTVADEEYLKYEIALEEHAQTGMGYLGIGFVEQESRGVMGKVYSGLSSFKEANIYYEPKVDGWSWFIYHLLWWLVLISISVALVNMLPVGIFDGGRFFYLTVLGITGSKKKAEKSFAFMTYFFLFLLLLLMVFWALSFF